jgi:hypothetical protein
MIVTVITIRMMQMTIDKIIDMIAMRHRFVPTTRSMFVADLVTAAIVVGRAALGVFGTDFQDMILDQRRANRTHRVMEMTVVEVIDMVVVFESSVPAVRAMSVTVIGMGRGSTHS